MKIAGLIEGSLRDYDLEYRLHATPRMFERNIHKSNIEITLGKGDVIERYEEDFPLPSVLINGHAAGGKSLHLVVGINQLERKFVIITVYEPDPQRWTKDFSRRTP